MKHTLFSFLLLGCIGEDPQIIKLRVKIQQMEVEQRIYSHRKLCKEYGGFVYTNEDNIYCDLALKNGLTVTLRNGQIIGD